MLRAVLLLFPFCALAAPIQLVHSGRAFDAGGTPIDGDHDVTVSLWDDATSTDLAHRVWTELNPSVPLADGIYTVLLGDGTTLQSELFSQDLWIEIDAAGAVGQRQPLVSVPRAAHTEGTVRLGDANVVCDASVEGLLRYRSGTVEVCSGSGWLSLTGEAPVESCATIGANASGVYTFDPDGSGPHPTEDVFCDFDTPGGPWTVLQWDTSNNQQAGVHGTVSDTVSGWSLDYTTPASFWNSVPVSGFYIAIDGGTKYTWNDVVLFGTSVRPDPSFLFTGGRNNSWSCNSDTPNGQCHLTDNATGRHWGQWVHTTGCCSVGRGTWYFSDTAADNLNYGLCSHLYPNGVLGTTEQGCHSGQHNTFSSDGAGVFRFAIKY